MTLDECLRRARFYGLRPKPRITLIEWCDKYRQVPSKVSARPGQWRTSTQPSAFGPMSAVGEPDTSTVTICAGTQILKTEFLLNVCAFYIDQDPSAILFVQPTQGAAESFSKERFAPMVAATPRLAKLVETPRSRDSENTIAHKNFPGGSLDFVGANSPTDLASRPKRIVLSDEIDKYPLSAGTEGNPLALAEERASTYKNVGRALFVRTCSPTDTETSRIWREYELSDQRRLFVPCPKCSHTQTLNWSKVQWDKDSTGNHLPETACIVCDACGEHWAERERLQALGGLEFEPGYGWRQTRIFTCCGASQVPCRWDDRGRALCSHCYKPAPYDGHAGFHVSKLYSACHSLAEVVREFLEAKGSPELVRKWTNTSLAETWRLETGEGIVCGDLQARAENYGPDDLPLGVKCVVGAADIQSDRIEVQFIGFGADEEAWPCLYAVIDLDPSQGHAWRELDVLISRVFRRRDNIPLRCAAFAIDTGGFHGSMVADFARKRRGRRIYPIKGVPGKKLIWSGNPSQTKLHDKLWLIGVEQAKDSLFGRLKILPNEDGSPTPGCIHFPVSFGPEYYKQLTSERREVRYKFGQKYTVYVLPEHARNEALDTWIYAAAVRRSLPRVLEQNLEYSIEGPVTQSTSTGLKPIPPEESERLEIEPEEPRESIVHQGLIEARERVRRNQGGWIRGGASWMDRGW